MNIIYEDVSPFLETGSPVLVPFLVWESDKGLEVETYSSLKDHISLVLEKHGSSLFSKKAIDYLDFIIEPYFNRLGYYRESVGLYKWFLTLEPSENYIETTKADTRSAVRLEREHLSLENLTTFDLCELLDKELCSYICIEDNKVVAIATVNDNVNETRVLEATVECAPRYRRRGYALAALVSLTKFILSMGKSVSYVSSKYNRASIKLAKKANFRQTGRFYAYTVFKDE